ncbi:Odorant receptor [Operophtera brumata]|uniref:Odorant receptor n=1 Tax=Operophtera brumata TaxID=104452 RepID=A0A0L7LCD2_OPEBR|nr:Odorant receptor [Operophtera brumata]
MALGNSTVRAIKTMAKSYKIVYYRPIYENLYSELRGMWPRGPVTDEEHQIVNTALNQLNIVIQGYDVPLILPFFYWFPFDPFARFDLLAVRIRKLVYVPIDGQLFEEFPLAAYSKEHFQTQKRIIESYGERDWERRHLKELSEIVVRHRALIRSQKEVHVTTYGFSVISLASYTTIIKTAWSYFTLLLNIYKR